MGWFLSLLFITALLAFSVFATDTVIRLRRDVTEMNKTLLRLVDAGKAQAQAPAAAAGASGAAAAAAAAGATKPPVQKI
jgi:hypothetical protein